MASRQLSRTAWRRRGEAAGGHELAHEDHSAVRDLIERAEVVGNAVAELCFRPIQLCISRSFRKGREWQAASLLRGSTPTFHEALEVCLGRSATHVCKLWLRLDEELEGFSWGGVGWWPDAESELGGFDDGERHSAGQLVDGLPFPDRPVDR